MNVSTRRRKFNPGFALMEEAVMDALETAEAEGAEGLDVVQVMVRLGQKADYRGARHGIVRRVLLSLAEEGVAVNDLPGPGRTSWRLVRQEESP